CLQCGREFSARHSRVFSGFHTDEKTIHRVLKALAEGNGLRACARIFDIDTGILLIKSCSLTPTGAFSLANIPGSTDLRFKSSYQHEELVEYFLLQGDEKVR